MSDFFAKRKRSSRIDLASPTATPAPPKKKYANHQATNNFSRDNIDERIKKLSAKGPKLDWRKVQNVIDIPYTYVIQRWEFEGKSQERFHFSPWGVHGMIQKKMTAIQVKNSFQSLPAEVKEALDITEENFKRDDILVTASNTGYHAKKPFVRLFCAHCQEQFIPKLLNNPRYGNCKTFEDFLASWDDMKVSPLLSGVIGCFICLDPKVHAGPNTKNYLKEPIEHIKSYHPDIVAKDVTAKQLKFKKDIQLLIAPTATGDGSEVPMPTLKAVKPSTSSASTASVENLPNQTHLIGRFFRKTTYQTVSSSMVQKLKTSDDCATTLQRVAKGFCFSVVHNGVNKRVSEATTIEQYKISFRGILDHYLVQKADLEERYGHTTDITMQQPQECCLDKNNIVKYEKCILEVYITDPESLYSIVVNQAPFWGIMHDGIMKFSVEYNGMFIAAVHPDTFKLILVPFRLMKMKGCVNAHDVVESLFVAFAEFMKLKDSAFHSVRKIPDLENCSVPPTFFKLGHLLINRVSATEIHIEMSNRLPIANVGDGVSVNVKAARVASQLYGLSTPSLRCASHSVDGCWKRIAKSETMSVEAVKTLYANLKTVVKHFKFSGKSKELLDSSMAMLEMNKGIHLITWCATRMAHFLVACERFNDLLVPIYNTMYTENLKPEERDKLFQVENVFTMKVVSDIHGIMHNKLLRSVDKSECLVSTAYATAQSSANKVINMKPPSAEIFMNSLSIDPNGNLMFEQSIHGNKHTLRLSNPHHPKRGQTEEQRLQKIKDSLGKIQDEILKNIHDNQKDQIGEDTYFYAWSGLDMSDKTCNLDQRLLKLDPLLELFTSDRVHEVQKYRTAKEDDDTVPLVWENRKVYLHYSAPISSSHDELVAEVKAAWPFVSRSWLKHPDKKDQRGFFEAFLSGPDAGIQFPNFCNFLMILLSTPANTSPLERSYSGLEMICTPRRNHIKPDHLECLYLLSSLQLPVKSSTEYRREIDLLK